MRKRETLRVIKYMEKHYQALQGNDFGKIFETCQNAFKIFMWYLNEDGDYSKALEVIYHDMPEHLIPVYEMLDKSRRLGNW